MESGESAQDGCWSPPALQGGVPVFPKARGSRKQLKMPEQPRTGAQAFRGRGRLQARRAGPRETVPHVDRRGSGNPAAGRGALGPARSPRQGTASSQFPSRRALRFPGAPPPGTKRRKRAGRDEARPLLRPRLAAAVVHPESIFDEGGVPPTLPQITFATSSQPVESDSAGHERLGTSELGPTVPRPSRPRSGPRRFILPSPATSPSWKRSSGLAVTQRRNVASRASRLDARLGWGCGGAREGPRRTAEEEE